MQTVRAMRQKQQIKFNKNNTENTILNNKHEINKKK